MGECPAYRLAFGIFATAFLASCQTGGPAAYTSINTKQQPQTAVARIAKVAQKCWFKSGDLAFKPYRLASEVSSFAGKPRFLIVPRKQPGALPLLVVQAEKRGSSSTGTYTNIQTFGPLLEGRHGKRILEDVNRWSEGKSNCKEA